MCLLFESVCVEATVSLRQQPKKFHVPGNDLLPHVSSSKFSIADMSGLQQPVLPPGHVWSTAASAAPWTCLVYSSQCFPLDMSGLQQPVLPLGMSGDWYTASSAAAGQV